MGILIKIPELTFIILDSVALDSEPAFLNEDGLVSSGSESPSPSTKKEKFTILQSASRGKISEEILDKYLIMKCLLWGWVY